MTRCTAKSKRSGEQCKNWAMRNKTTCRFHGGRSTGPKTDLGREKIKNAHFKHGLRSKEARQENEVRKKLLMEGRSCLSSFKDVLWHTSGTVDNE